MRLRTHSRWLPWCLLAVVACGEKPIQNSVPTATAEPQMTMGFKIPATAAARFRSGAEYSVALLASPSCHACKDSAFQAGWDRIVESLRAQAENDSATVAIIGVSADWSIDDGIDFLRHFRGLDEIDVGSSWLNLGFEEYAVQDFPSRASVPQIVVVRRVRRIDDAGMAVESKSLVHRSIGLSEIAQWAQNGAPIH